MFAYKLNTISRRNGVKRMQVKKGSCAESEEPPESLKLPERGGVNKPKADSRLVGRNSPSCLFAAQCMYGKEGWKDTAL